jgi:hypothetical protein
MRSLLAVVEKVVDPSIRKSDSATGLESMSMRLSCSSFVEELIFSLGTTILLIVSPKAVVLAEDPPELPSSAI